MDNEEKAQYRDWDIYIPSEFKKNNIIHVLGMKYDAGKKLEILDKAFEWNDKKKLQQKLSSLKGRKEGAQAMYIDSKLIYKQYYLGNWLLVLTMLGMGFMYKKNRQAIY